MQAQVDLTREVPHRMTEAEFDAWMDEDVWAEFQDGAVITKMPALMKHELLCKFLLILLELFTTHKGLGLVLGSQYAIRLRPDLRHVPDLLFVSQARPGIVGERFVEGAPDLVVEIVSPDSVARDWRDKYIEYAEAGVREYWVFDPQSEHVEWYALNPEGHYEMLGAQDGVLRSRVLEGFYLRLERLWQGGLPDPLKALREMGIDM